MGEQVAQSGKEIPDGCDQRHCAVGILDVGARNDCRKQRSHGVEQDMPLAAFHRLSGVIDAWAAALDGLNLLGVDDASSGAGLATGRNQPLAADRGDLQQREDTRTQFRRPLMTE
jgi:hypothetical protein